MATAQTSNYPGNHIIQYYPTTNACIIWIGVGCAQGTPALTPSEQIQAIEQFESDSIKMYLASLGDSATDADVTFFYEYARADWRTAVRAFWPG